MSSRRRGSSKRRDHRQGLSGNPQRRAEQLRAAEVRSAVRQLQRADPDREGLGELAYRLAGGAPAAAWWRESHERILTRARGLSWPTRLADLETQACQIVGDEFYERLQSPATGLHPAQWLRALAEETGTAVRAAVARGSEDWPRLWAFLCGLVLTTPVMLPDAASETGRSIREMFPDIADPLQVVRAEAAKAAGLLANHGLETGAGYLSGGSRPTGEALLARDEYGSRFLLTAPFGYGEGTPDHWYAWDIDTCWLHDVVAAGVFASTEEALADWRDAVGWPGSGAALSPCAEGMTAWLLAPSLRTGFPSDTLQGHEPRELIREYYRFRRRARDLADSMQADPGTPPFDAAQAHDAFLDWYASRHDDAPAIAAEDAGTILTEWGPHEILDERSFYACSPHRIEMAARLIRDGYLADDANAALRLLPDWTEWCIERSGLGGAAARSRDAARAAASALVDGAGDEPLARNDDTLFRRPE